MGRIHNVFHVDLLSPHPPEFYPQRKPAPQPPIEIEGEPEFEVQEILDCKRVAGKLRYLVRWEGYGPEDDTWEPLVHLPRAKEAIEEFYRSHPRKAPLRQGEWEWETQ